jgi:hypothetical protein
MSKRLHSIQAFVSLVFAIEALCLAQPISSQPLSEGTSIEGHRYSMTITPKSIGIGDLAIVDIQLEGVSASSARVSELRLDQGLKLEAESLRPGLGSNPAAPRADFRFELRVLEPGELKIESLAIVADGQSLNFGPFVVHPSARTVAGSSGSGSTGGDRAFAWRWVAPQQAYRYEAFELKLVYFGDRANSSPAAESSVPQFAPPFGTSVEASGNLSWTVIAFEEGDLLIPEAAIGSGPSVSRAKETKVTIMPLPTEIKASRAIGQFTLALKGKDLVAPVAGTALSLRLVLEGRGNLPALILSEPEIKLDGVLLPREAWTSSRVDEAKPEMGMYSGSASLVLEITPPRSGTLALTFSPLAVLSPGSSSSVPDGPAHYRISSLVLSPREIRVRSAGSLTAAPREAMNWGPSLSKAAETWARGDRGSALAQVYGALRRAPPLSREANDAKKAALACASLLGTSPPVLDALPSQIYFAIAALLVAFAGLSLFMVSKVSGHASRNLKGEAALLFLALVLCGFYALSAAERREKYAVIWTDSLRTVPSAQSELSVAVAKGSTARLRGFAGPYAGVVLADGVEGWASRDSLFWY